MKKIHFIYSLFICVLIGTSLLTASNSMQAAPLMFDEGTQCKAETFPCVGLTVSRVICHKNGDGLNCTTCGESTECKDHTVY